MRSPRRKNRGREYRRSAERRKLHGYNTDYAGVLQTLERRIELRGSRVLIMGAGGAARAVAFALAQAGQRFS